MTGTKPKPDEVGSDPSILKAGPWEPARRGVLQNRIVLRRWNQVTARFVVHRQIIPEHGKHYFVSGDYFDDEAEAEARFRERAGLTGKEGI